MQYIHIYMHISARRGRAPQLFAQRAKRMDPHDRPRQEKLSRLRRELLELQEQLGKTLEVAWAGTPLVKGSVYEIARRCGNPQCRCTRGQLHRNIVVTWSDQGRHRMRSLPPERVREIRQKSKEYARFRRARAEVSSIHDRMVVVLDRIQELRRQIP